VHSVWGFWWVGLLYFISCFGMLKYLESVWARPMDHLDRQPYIMITGIFLGVWILFALMPFWAPHYP